MNTELLNIFLNKDITHYKSLELESLFSKLLEDNKISISRFSVWVYEIYENISSDVNSKTGILIWNLTEEKFNNYFRKIILNKKQMHKQKEYRANKDKLCSKIIELILNDKSTLHLWNIYLTDHNITNLKDFLIHFGLENNLITKKTKGKKL